MRRLLRSEQFDPNAIETEEAGRTRQSSSPQTLRQRIAEAKKRQIPSIPRDGWLSPLTFDKRGPLGPQASRGGVRASDTGFLSLSLPDYLKLLDWTSRQRVGSLEKAVVPNSLEPILTRIGIEGSMFSDLVWNFEKYFNRSTSAGSPKRMKENAASRGRKFTPGQRSASSCFVDS